jgi:ferrous iron transport protein A
MKQDSLGSMKRHQSGVITQVEHPDPAVLQRLLEMGFLVGARVEVVHEAPFGADPIAVRVRGALVAVRREDALKIGVEV